MDGSLAAGGGGGGASTETAAVAVAEPPGPVAVIVYVVESDGVTLVEPCAVTVPTSGEMVSEVASVEFQLKVDASPLLMEVGLAWSVTVGRAGGAAGAGGVGGAAAGFFPQPKVKTVARSATDRQARYSLLEAGIMRFLLRLYGFPCSPTRAAVILTLAGWVRGISRITIYYTSRTNAHTKKYQ